MCTNCQCGNNEMELLNSIADLVQTAFETELHCSYCNKTERVFISFMGNKGYRMNACRLDLPSMHKEHYAIAVNPYDPDNYYCECGGKMLYDGKIISEE